MSAADDPALADTRTFEGNIGYVDLGINTLFVNDRAYRLTLNTKVRTADNMEASLFSLTPGTPVRGEYYRLEDNDGVSFPITELIILR